MHPLSRRDPSWLQGPNVGDPQFVPLRPILHPCDAVFPGPADEAALLIAERDLLAVLAGEVGQVDLEVADPGVRRRVVEPRGVGDRPLHLRRVSHERRQGKKQGYHDRIIGGLRPATPGGTVCLASRAASMTRASVTVTHGSAFGSACGARLILDATRVAPHPSQFHLDRAVEVAQELAAGQTYLTHPAHVHDYEEADLALPQGVSLPHDGLRIRVSGWRISQNARSIPKEKFAIYRKYDWGRPIQTQPRRRPDEPRLSEDRAGLSERGPCQN
ncbi:MAG: hypothetical protein IH851_03070 [Armatimonadetes bacterium]|nr:hypothetical protein [Armatimonadota bacterium]